MKRVFIEFQINENIEPIGFAIIDTESQSQTASLSLRTRRSTAIKLPPEPKKNNKIVIPRTVLTQKKRRLKRKRNKKESSIEEEEEDSFDSYQQREEETSEQENLISSEIPKEDYEEENDEPWDEEDSEEEDNLVEDEMDLMENSYQNNEKNQNNNSEEGEESEISVTGYENKRLTKRQMMSRNIIPEADKLHIQLPDKKPRKKRTLLMTEEQQIKKMEKEEKRRINTLRQIEEHKQQTVDKILNESGRMQKQRKEKEERDALKKTQYIFRKLPEGDVIVKYISNKRGEKLILDKTIPSGNWLLNDHELSFYGGQTKKREKACGICGKPAKYKLEKNKKIDYCGIECFKKIKT